jgi:hypothetical protein
MKFLRTVEGKQEGTELEIKFSENKLEFRICLIELEGK